MRNYMLELTIERISSLARRVAGHRYSVYGVAGVLFVPFVFMLS